MTADTRAILAAIDALSKLVTAQGVQNMAASQEMLAFQANVTTSLNAILSIMADLKAKVAAGALSPEDKAILDDLQAKFAALAQP